MAGSGMIIDGVAASEAIDSSGEILDVEGCDISDLQGGGATLNYEHRGDDAPGASPNDHIGRIIFAKKIFKEGDCTTARERKYWREVSLPFIYIRARLLDGAGHPGAIAAAAHIRDAVANGEPINVRYSIEGSTIEKKGQKLARSIARRVAATFKPCNRSCESGMISDPHSPWGSSKGEEASAVEKAERHPAYMPLGGSREYEGMPWVAGDDEQQEMVEDLEKNGGDVAPSQLTGLDALAVEDLGQKRKRFLKNQALAALRDWDKTGSFREFLKHRLPEADPSFIDRFAGLVDDYSLKKKHEESETQQLGGGVTVPEPPNKNPEPHTAAPTRTNSVRMTDSGRLFLPANNPLNRSFVDMHFPDDDNYHAILNHETHPHLSDEQRELYDRTVHGPWERAMSYWLPLNAHLGKKKKVPESVLWHSAMFSAMSPNTPVPLQELYYGYVQDLIHQHGFDPTKPVSRTMSERLRQMIGSGMQPPDWNRDHYIAQSDKIAQAAKDQEKEGLQDYKQGLLRAPTARNPGTGNGRSVGDPPQILAFENYFKYHPHVLELMRHHGDDARAVVSTMMHMKHQHKLVGGDDLPYPDITGMGPKLARYMTAMAGAGNVLVPDRHLVRSIFNLNLDDDRGLNNYLATSILTKAHNDHILQAMDNQFFAKHPAVKYVLNKYPEHFKGREQQAIFPAFWLHWLSIPHYEKARQMPHKGYNSGTDHQVFWDSITDTMRRHRIPVPDDMFKSLSRSDEPMPVRTARATHDIMEKHGEAAALWTYFAHMVPALLSSEHATHMWEPSTPESEIHKFEELEVALRRAVTVLKKADELSDPGRAQSAAPARFAQHDMQPGEAVALLGRYKGKKYAVLHQDATHYFVAPPNKLHDVRKWPKAKEHSHFRVTSLPQALDAPGRLDSSVHSIPELTLDQDQHNLLHGMDLNALPLAGPSHTTVEREGINARRGVAQWMKTGRGTPGYMKRAIPSETEHLDNFSTARREALYHNLARDFFGLGHYVPVTAAFRHPTTGAEHSIMEAVPNAEHVSYVWAHPTGNQMVMAPHQLQTVRDLGDSGELDKLMLMNAVQGSRDRYSANYLFKPEFPGLALIDHGYTHAASRGVPGETERTQDEGYNHEPHYQKAYTRDRFERGVADDADWKQELLNPTAAEWFLKLQPKDLVHQMRQQGSPKPVVERALTRLLAMQHVLKQRRTFTSKGDLYRTAWAPGV